MERKKRKEIGMAVEQQGGDRSASHVAAAAAAASAVIPFCCIICFDEFCPVQRPPMVLPCGHTYVCLPCTKRLKKCMECRQPLFLPASTASTTTTGIPNNSAFNQQQQQQRGALGRYAITTNNNNNENAPYQQYHQPQPTIPLPIPKNLVLLSMMEAAERQSRTHSSTVLSPSPPPLQLEEQDGDVVADAAAADDEQDDDGEADFDKIITGMAALSGPCGTYAVREPNGLWVVPHDPRLQKNNNNNNNNNSTIVGIEVPDLCEGETTTTEAFSPKTSLLDETAMNSEAEEEEDDSTSVSSSSSSNENESSSTAEVEENGDNSREDVAAVQMSPRVEDSDELNENSAAPLDVSQRDENESIVDEKEESFIIQSRQTISFELAPRPKGLLPAALEPQQQEEEHQSSSFLLEYGQTVQVVSFYSGVAKLARDSGYIAASPRQLVKVGEPLDESCRIQGLLDTVWCRGKGLEKTLDENRLIAEGLQRQLDAAFEMQPNHPIISLKTLPENRAPPVGTASPRTPNGPAYSPPLSAMQTPKKMDYFEPLTPTQHRTGSFDSHQNHHPGCKISPAPRTPDFDATKNGIRIGFAATTTAPTMPRYHAADRQHSMDEGDSTSMDFGGCGSTFMGPGGAAELFGEGFAGSHDLSDDDYDHHHLHRQTQQHHPQHHHPTSHANSGGGGVPSLNPSLSASFDVVDFRTGMSCHRALNATKYGRSPAPPRRQVRTMGDHRGIAPIRTSLSSQQRRLQSSFNNNNNGPMFPTYSTPNGEEVAWYKE